MSRQRFTLARILGVLPIALGLGLGCSTSEPSEEAPSSQKSTGFAQREAFVWPAGGGAPRDIDADLGVCNREIEGVQNWMVGVQKLVTCMTAQGWELKNKAQK